MKNILSKIFKKNRGVVIGAIHLPPLLGYSRFPGFSVAIKNALCDLRALEEGGANGIIFENNYDLPHKIFVDAPVVSAMTIIGEELKKATSLPIGVSVLWNDYKTALSIARTLDLQFIRIPVFVDKVKTAYGIISGEPKKVVTFRKSIGADNIALFTDIHVKHAKLLSRHNLITSARIAVKNKSDAIIVTGKWTGDAPDLENMETLRKEIANFPILVGSGLDENNAGKLFQFANGAIVSTSLKSGPKKSSEVNVKSYEARINMEKVKNLMRRLQ